MEDSKLLLCIYMEKQCTQLTHYDETKDRETSHAPGDPTGGTMFVPIVIF